MHSTKKRFQRLNIILPMLAMACLFYYDYRGGLALKDITKTYDLPGWVW